MTLENLLNILLERGWKPRNREKTLHICCYGKCKWMDYQWVHLDGWFMNEDSKKFRELVSKESWLWQFCVENGMININYWNIREYYSEQDNWWIYLRRLNGEDNYEYRLIESSLKNKDELEEFLLENIQIWN